MMGPSATSNAPKPKKQFLKRRTQKVNPTSNTPKPYNYYADHFEGDGAEKTRDKRKTQVEETTATTYHSKTSAGPRK